MRQGGPKIELTPFRNLEREPVSRRLRSSRLFQSIGRSVPQKLVQLFLFTVRYISVFEREYDQLQRAMTIRAFEPRLNLHTLHSYGNLVGMLLVGALDRSERVNQAMKCRGFSGRFPLFFEYRFTMKDFAFFMALVLPLNLLLVMLIVAQ